MAFNWKQFAGSFLSELAEGIEEREDEAKELQKKEEEKAQRNYALIQERTAKAKEAARIGEQAMSLGASKEQVINAMSTGTTGVVNLLQKLQAIHASQKLRPGQMISKEDIELGISMPTAVNVDPNLIAMDLEKLAKRAYGVSAPERPKSTSTPESSVIRSLFGFDEKERVQKKLQQDSFLGDMSIADINFAAEQGEFQELIPNAVMNFADLPRYDADAKYEFATALTENMVNAVEAREDEIKALRIEDPAAAAKLTKQIQMATADMLFKRAAGNYGQMGFFDDPTTRKLIIQTMDVPGTPENEGVDYYNSLMQESFPERDPLKLDAKGNEITKTIEDATEVVSESIEEEKAKEKEKLKPVEKEKILTKKRIEENVYYRNDEGDVVKGVPPRPTRDFSTLFFGSGMGGDDIEAILKGEMPVPKYLRPGQWDELFADTHNPDGSPKNLKGE